MRLENISKRTYQHSVLDNKTMRVNVLELKPGENREIPDNIAAQWLKSGEVRVYIAPAEAKAKEDALKAENEALKKELEALKAAKTEAEKEETKKTASKK